MTTWLTDFLVVGCYLRKDNNLIHIILTITYHDHFQRNKININLPCSGGGLIDSGDICK